MGLKKSCGCVVGTGLGALVLTVAFSRVACSGPEPKAPQQSLPERAGSAVVESAEDLGRGVLEGVQDVDWEGLGREAGEATREAGKAVGGFIEGLAAEDTEGEDKEEEPAPEPETP